jgi:hypothetical protein
VDVHQVRIVDRDPTELHDVSVVDFAGVDGVRDRNDSAFLAGYVGLIVEDPPVERWGIRNVHVRIVAVNRDRWCVGGHSASMNDDRHAAGFGAARGRPLNLPLCESGGRLPDVRWSMVCGCADQRASAVEASLRPSAGPW